MDKQGEGGVTPQPEQQARETIDRLLTSAGWHVCDAAQANIHAAKGVAIREFPLNISPSPRERGEGRGEGRRFADYLLYIDGKAAGVIESDDFESASFAQQGGLGKAHQLFTDKLGMILVEPNQKLVA